MQTTASGVIDRIRALLGDTNLNNVLVSYDRLKRMVDDAALEFASQIPVNRTTQSLALTNGNYQANLTSSGKLYLSVNHVVDDQNRPVPMISLERLLELRRDGATGRPRAYAVGESVAGVVTLSFWPTPNAAFTFTVYVQELPIWMVDAATFSTGLAMSESTLSTGATWPFDEPTMRALEKAVALQIVLMTPADELQKRGLSKDVAGLWSKQVEQAKSRARVRIARQRRSGMIEMGAR